MAHDLKSMRENYMKGALDISNTEESPMKQFRKWFDDAVQSELAEPNAMILATATAEGKPSARAMLLKEYNDQGFIFFTNKGSRKGEEMLANPQAALLFFWGELERQVRIEGHLEEISDGESDDYFYSRPVGSQYGAMASPQSKEIESREWIEKQVETLMADGPPKRPALWGGFRLVPHRMEFWQGRPSRLHDRIQYEQVSGEWVRRRLAP
jgi:pyridoxamine 5'-phosphate oxidase